MLEKGDKIEVVEGKHKGRTGVFRKNCSGAFPEYCRIDLDLKPKQRVQETFEMILIANIKKVDMPKKEKRLDGVVNGEPVKIETPAKFLGNPGKLAKLLDEKHEEGISGFEELLKTDATFRMVKLRDILPDPNQPRKYFDETAMRELTESVKKNGVLQPVLLRTTDSRHIDSERVAVHPSVQNGFKDFEMRPKRGDPIYMIVCGERRYNAAMEAGLEEIPAVIRNLDDREALELQIIENLQRKDVQPMEEAVSFDSLHKQHGFSIEEIAARVGKTPHYVAQRLKLNDLAEDWQKILFAGKMNLTDAYRLCRFAAAVQMEIYKSCRIPADWANRKEWEVDINDYVFRHQEQELDSAPFKTEDPNLYPEAGACGTCPHNSHFQKLIFPDQKKRICHNGVCYAIKSQKHYEQTIQQVVEDPEVLLVSTDHYPDDTDKVRIKAAMDMGGVVLERDMFEVIERPEKPPTWEEFQKSEHDDDPDQDEEEKAIELAEMKEEWEEANKEYEQELHKYRQFKEDGRLRKAFVVAGRNSEEGKFIDIILKPGKKGAAALTSTGSKSSEIIALETELAGVKDREARAKEMDREKVFKKLAETLNSDAGYLLNREALKRQELDSLVFYFYRHGANTAAEWLDKQIGTKDRYTHSFETFKIISSFPNPGILFQFLRRAILDILISKSGPCDYTQYGDAAAVYHIAEEYIPTQLAVIKEDQKVKADKRINNVDKRIAELEAKIKELKEAAATAPKNSGKKKAPASEKTKISSLQNNDAV